MELAEAWRALPLGVVERHAEALTLAATRALRAGEAADAFELIDRRCRLTDRPRAVDLAVRALASHLCGYPGDAERDLARAEAADPLDPMVALTRLRVSRGAAALDGIARSVAVAAGNVPGVLLGAVAGRLASGGPAPALVGLDVLDAHLSGFALWPAGRNVLLELDGPGGALVLPLAPDRSLGWIADGIEASHVDAALCFDPALYVLREGHETILAEGRLWPRRSRTPGGRGRARAPAAIPSRAPLTVIVPVYRGAEPLRDCLRALAAETGQRPDTRVVVVDDASPDEEVARFLDRLAAEGSIELRRNAANLGFAGAVNRGREGEDGRDVLFLNADATLPPGALDRLTDALYSAPDIGTATPFSNNGEYASLPHHAKARPAPSPAEAAMLDRVAAEANATRTVDIPTGTGFCLLARHDALAAVGGMPRVYGRGYFEDMEFCLLARRAGFRSVCAASVFVVHHGSASFGADKRALATRNLAILRQRFPGIEAQCEAYAEADPLREARERVIAKAGVAFPDEGEAAEIGSAPGPGSPNRPPTLGAVMPVPSPTADAALRRLSAALRMRLPAARIVVLGRTCDDLALMGRGNVFVVGPVAPADLRGLAHRYGIAAFVPPLHDPLAELPGAIRALGLPVLHPVPVLPSEPYADATDHDASHVIDPAHAIVDQFARRIAA